MKWEEARRKDWVYFFLKGSFDPAVDEVRLQFKVKEYLCAPVLPAEMCKS
jgi:hypothetical protein